MPSDLVIANLENVGVPSEYDIPDSLELLLKVVTAEIDGSGAAGQFVPQVEIISPAGLVVARCPLGQTLAAGVSADVSWFRLSRRTSSASSTSPYEQLVLGSPLLRAYYKLDETTGTTLVDSGPLRQNGVYTNGPTLGQPPLADRTAVLFNAASLQWATAPVSAAFGATGPQAVAAWLKTTDVPATTALIVNVDNNNFRYLQLRITNAGKVEYIVFDTGNANSASLVSAASVNDGARHFVVGTWDGGQLQRILIDGAVAASQTTALVGQSTRLHDYNIAARNVFTTANYYTGTIDEVSIYNGCPPDSYFTAMYNAGLLA